MYQMLTQSCKLDFTTGKFYLPPEANCSVRFMRDVLIGRKNVSQC